MPYVTCCSSERVQGAFLMSINSHNRHERAGSLTIQVDYPALFVLPGVTVRATRTVLSSSGLFRYATQSRYTIPGLSRLGKVALSETNLDLDRYQGVS